jgi:UrcA family protein
MRNAFTIALTAALITTAAIKAAPAFAESPAPATNVSLVRTADLDLGSEAGRNTLDSRLVRAVRDVCGTASDADLEGQNAVRACREQTLAQARGRGALLVAAVSSGETLAITAAR